MPRQKKELIVKVGPETLKIREGESRVINFPMTLRMLGGTLFLTLPDVVTEEVKDDK